MTIGDMIDRYMNNQATMMSIKCAYKHGGNQAFYGSENEPEHLEGVAIQADGTPVAWVGKYTRYFSINPVVVTDEGKLKIKDYSCGGTAVGCLNIDFINRYNSSIYSESKKIVDWMEF